jgi:putative serine/threonine protein kinase
MKVLDPEDARKAICYPRPATSLCEAVIDELRAASIDAIVDSGRVVVEGVHVLGKGWSSIVLLALRRGELVAVKVLRQDSRRRSLLWEAVAWSIAAQLGVAPPVYYASRWILVTKAIMGPTLGEYRPRSCWEGWLVVRRLIVKAWLLDRVGILHNELARPGKQVVLEGSEPYIVDYESSTPARPGTRRTNLAQLVGGLKRYEWARRAAPGLGSEHVAAVLRRYKSDRARPVELLEEVVTALGEPARGCRV